MRDELGSLAAFVAVAEAKSFTRAAGKLGTSQSALSHRVRRLEERLGIRLLTRSTRSVAVTEAGMRLLETLAPALDEIDAKLGSLNANADAISGSLRISSADHAAETIIWPTLRELLPHYPDICVHVIVDNQFVDIVAERFDAGVRLGDFLSKDMIAVPIGPPERTVVVGAPAYFARHGKPQSPSDLVDRRCINRQMSTAGIMQWDFSRNGRPQRIRVTGPLVFDRPDLMIEAAVEGFGMAYVLESQVRSKIFSGELETVLDEWSISVPGYHLYYPSRKHQSPALTLLINALRCNSR